jgi:hypothetical protein
MQRRPPRGSYLLEASIVTFAAAFFLVGASDVSRIFHARSAVRAGVREGLRCLYPTDAGCALADTVNPAPANLRYNVSVWDESAQYVVPTEIWRAQAEWMMEPELTIPLEATRVSQATVQLAREKFREHEILFPVQGHHPYLVQQREFPIIGGLDPLNPEFRDRVTRARVSPNQTLGISGIRGTTRSVPGPLQSGFEPQFRIGSAQFSLRDAWPGRDTELLQIRALEQRHSVKIECYAGELLREASPARIDWGRLTGLPPLCRYRGGARLFSSDGLRVPLMLRLTGSTRGTSAAGQGKALIQLRWTMGSSRAEQRLGGRLLSAGASGNFVVRGAGLDDIAVNARTPYEKGGTYFEELRDNGTIMLVPAAAQVFVDVFLVSLNGQPVSWQGGSLELFYPSFSLFPERYSCEPYPNPAICAGAVPVKPLYTSLELERALGSRESFATECSREAPDGYERDPGSFLAALHKRLLSGEAARSTTFWALDSDAASTCAPISRTVSCSGAAHEHLKGCGECQEVDERRLPEGCEEASFDPARDRVTDLSCRTASLEQVERRMGCSDAALPACAKPHARHGSYSLLQGSPQCEYAQRHSPPELESDPTAVSRCGATPQIADQYRTRHNVPAGVEVVLTKAAGPDAVSTNEPDDPCVVYEPGIRRSPERPCGAMLSSEGAAQCCAGSGGRCIVRSVLLPQSSWRSGGLGPEVSGAVQRAARTVKAAYPQAQRQESCDGGGAHCLSVSASEISSEGSASVRASLTVPLRLASLFGEGALTVEHQESRKLEQAVLLE